MTYQDHLTPNTCSHCGAPVSVRRPSRSGLHYCSAKKDCQSAKQKAYRDLRKSEVAADVEAMRLELLRDALHGSRDHCHACGLENALVGWAHRSGPAAAKPCFALGNKGAAVGITWIDAIHPERAPQP